MKRCYFPHDHHARNDRKLQALLVEEGLQGIGAYWCIIEMLYEEGGKMPTHYERISKSLHCSIDLVKKVVCDYELFSVNCTTFWSVSAIKRIKEIDAKSETARASAMKRWDANALRPECERNASKVKESKVKKSNIPDDFLKVWNLYPKRIGMKDALRHWNASVKTEQDLYDIQKALNNYKNSKPVIEWVDDGKYVKSGSTWFNNWRDYIEPTGKQVHAGLAELQTLMDKEKEERVKKYAIA